jgi:hypothetical protein
MLTMPAAYGSSARKVEAPLAQIAKDFGLSVTTRRRWQSRSNPRLPSVAFCRLSG